MDPALERLAAVLARPASWADERLLRRSAQEEDRRGRRARHAQGRDARTSGVGIPSVKRYVAAYRQGRSLAPKKRPGSRPKLDEGSRRPLEADLEERPAVTLPQRREFLQRAAGVRVSDSTISRALKRLGRSRKRSLGAAERDELLRRGAAASCCTRRPTRPTSAPSNRCSRSSRPRPRCEGREPGPSGRSWRRWGPSAGRDQSPRRFGLLPPLRLPCYGPTTMTDALGRSRRTGYMLPWLR
jgi:transposase